MYSKVVGVTHSNLDKTSRQAILRRMAKTAGKGDFIELRREPDNPYDGNAIAVYTAEGEQIGYLNRETAKEFAECMDDGERVSATLDKIIGGDGYSYGCIIDLAVNGVKVLGGRIWDDNSERNETRRNKHRDAAKNIKSRLLLLVQIIVFIFAFGESKKTGSPLSVIIVVAISLYWCAKLWCKQRRTIWTWILFAIIAMYVAGSIGFFLNWLNRG